MKKSLIALALSLPAYTFAQVDTSYVFKTGMPYGTLDIRIAKSASRYYYLEENKTISFRENPPGVKTNTYFDMTTWDSSPYTQGNMREKNGTSDTFIMNYRLLFPSNYDANYAAGYPLILFMHGAGERANCWDNNCYHDDRTWTPLANDPPAPTDPTSRLLNNDHNLLHGGKVYLDARNLAGSMLPDDPNLPAKAFPAFVLFPQNLNGWTSTQDAIKLTRLVAQKYNVDENRIYITGLSNGGQAVYDVVKRAPWLFAAALPMSASGDSGLFTQELTSQVAHIPFWIFQGGKDSSPTPVVTEGRVRKLREAGTVVRYRLYPNLGHGTWNSAFKEPDYFQWILGQDKSNIHFFAGSAFICPGNGVGARMELAAGFRAYQWERDGIVIPGADSAAYAASVPGVYRARFSRVLNPTEADWNKWSKPITVLEQHPAAAQIKQTGTVLLRDLNGFSNARLSSVAEAPHYHWFKDGVQLDLPDTTRYLTVTPGDCTGPCANNGSYSLVTTGYDNCPTPQAEAKFAFFEDQAPMNINLPTTFVATPTSQSTVKLTWKDLSSNESGFEIWRRRVLGADSYSPWEMAGLVAANIKIFTDKKLIPSTTYEYKIRAVGSIGRSDYIPSGVSGLAVTTFVDTTLPSTPQSLTASQTAINTIKLTWKASTDNSGIKQYRIYYADKTVLTNTPVTTWTLSNLMLNTVYTFTIQAEDLGGNLSAMSASATANTYVSGLYYEHSTGAWEDLDEINWNNKEFQGKVTTFSIGPRTQQDFFNFRFDGYLYINNAGSYEFQTTSSDGSRLELDGVMLVNNDGVHGSVTVSSTPVALTSGPKRIVVKYFELDDSHVLTVRYKGPDTNNSWLTIPSSALKSGDVPVMAGAGGEIVYNEEGAPDFSVYPNPGRQHELRIRLQGSEMGVAKINMIDLTGKVLYHRELAQEDAAREIEITPAGHLPEGLYFVVFHRNGKVRHQKVMIINN